MGEFMTDKAILCIYLSRITFVKVNTLVTVRSHNDVLENYC